MKHIKTFNEFNESFDVIKTNEYGAPDTFRVELPLCNFGCKFEGDRDWRVLNDYDGFVYGKTSEHFKDDGTPQIIWDIDIQSGVIKGWEGKGCSLYFKVVDSGEYALLANGVEVARAVNEYVPKFLQLDGDGWDDYISISVDSTGKIRKWDKRCATLVKNFF